MKSIDNDRNLKTDDKGLSENNILDEIITTDKESKK